MNHTPIWKDTVLLRDASRLSLARLNPWALRRNPVILVTYLSALVSTSSAVVSASDTAFSVQISIWLWLTVVFANFSEALAEGRGKAHANSLKQTISDRNVPTQTPSGWVEKPVSTLLEGDVIACQAGDMIPVDGDIIEGVASIDESAITGESAPVIRSAGGDRSAVTGGTTVLSDRIVIRVTAAPGSGVMDKLIGLIESATRQKTPNEKALELLLVALTVLFAVVTATLPVFVTYAKPGYLIDIPVLMALFVCLIPTTIGGLLGAVGIAGMDRLIRKNVVAKTGRAVEAAGDITVLLLDKTGTITHGNRFAVALHPAPGVSLVTLASATQLTAFSDTTPEGKSAYELACQTVAPVAIDAGAIPIPFTATTRMSGVTLPDAPITDYRKGAVDAIAKWVGADLVPAEMRQLAEQIGHKGGTPLGVAHTGAFLGIIELKDVVKTGIKTRFAQLREMGIKTVMITGDNPATAAAIAAEAGVDDYMAEATPEDKLNRIKSEQAKGYLVAMTGDGTNDAPALAQADVGVAMNLGTPAARDAGNMVDLDSNPTKLIEIVETGKQLLMTRGALTTFSIANDLAKYFAILPALFIGVYATSGQPQGPLGPLNIMHLTSANSAILSAVIFNALIVVALIPLALRGVRVKPQSASALLRRNLLIYGIGGLVAPFIGIKAIDMVLAALGLA